MRGHRDENGSGDCVDAELQLGADTGTWIPLVNDCHGVVRGILDKCRPHTLEAVVNADAERKLREEDGGAP